MARAGAADDNSERNEPRRGSAEGRRTLKASSHGGAWPSTQSRTCRSRSHPRAQVRGGGVAMIRLWALLMPLPELRMSFADQAALAQELASNLKHGRAFLLGTSEVEVLADCVLVLVHPESRHELGLLGQVVMVSDSEPMLGVGIQLRPFDPGVVQAIEAFVAGDPNARGTAAIAQPADQDAAAEEPAQASEPGDQAGVLHDEAGAEGERDDDLLGHDALELAEEDDAGEDDADQDGRDDEHEGEYGDEYEPPYPSDDALDAAGERGDAPVEPGTDAEQDGGDDESSECGSDLQKQPKRHERLRKLNVTQQHKLARSGELNDRVLLERIYGKGVWDGLLQNPKLTLPEVARIARKGSVPRPLIEQIVENNAWIQSPLVRRALLSNPRVSGEGILKLLRITPRHELKVIFKTTTYSTQVREAARKVLEM